MMKIKLFILILLLGGAVYGQTNLALTADVDVSSYRNEVTYPASHINDGIVSDVSRWLSATAVPSEIRFKLDKSYRLGGIHFYSGYGIESASPIKDFYIEFYGNEQWNAIPSASIVGNVRFGVAVVFDENVEVESDSLRIVITKTKSDIARVREMSIWEYAAEGMPKLGAGVEGYEPEVADAYVPLIYVNQSGYNLNKPKRFTAPTLADGTGYVIREKGTTASLYEGEIYAHKADFSDFNPISNAEFEIVADTNVSFPFRIGHWWLERVSYQGMIDFMMDSRHWTGNYSGTQHGSYGWRDDTHFGWELHTLVPQYLSHPEAYHRLEKQITYKSSWNNKWGALDAYDETAPDIVKLIHWGADIIVTQGLKHENMKSQLAYFLYAWPWLKEWLPQQNFDLVKAFVLQHWQSDITKSYAWDYDDTKHDLLALKTVMGTTKGERPPGRTVQPNLLMYEVAQRDGLPNPDRYFDAAFAQVEWMIDNIDWNDSITTKGQRMSEFHTMVGLSHMLKEYPDEAPEGLQSKIEAWADVMIRRSDNMWDFRKLTDDGAWVPYNEEKPTQWNEPGNVMGFPACLIAAKMHIEDDVKVKRLDEIAYSHLENVFGRNPCGRHFSYDGTREVEGVDLGWYSFYKGGIGMLENSRFVFDGAPKYNHYPYHPEIGNVGWTEGWVQFNVAFNLSMAYMANTDIEFDTVLSANSVKLRLKVPHNFDYDLVETIYIIERDENGERALVLTEESENSAWFSVDIEASEIETSYSYGFGYFEKSIVVAKPSTVGQTVEPGNHLLVYPNPASSELFISGLSDACQYKIYSLSGQHVEAGITSGTIATDSLEAGIYLLSLCGEQIKVQIQR